MQKTQVEKRLSFLKEERWAITSLLIRQGIGGCVTDKSYYTVIGCHVNKVYASVCHETDYLESRSLS